MGGILRVGDRRVKDTGWVRSNHFIDVEVYDGDIQGGSLVCPPYCPTIINDHLQYCLTEEEKIKGGGLYLGSQAPFLEYDDGKYFQCHIAYEWENVGLEKETCVDEDWIKKLVTLDEYYETVEVEFRVIYGWSPDTWVSPAEYDWEFAWRPVNSTLTQNVPRR